MIFFILAVLLTFTSTAAFPQTISPVEKPPINSTAVYNWPSISGLFALSNDGEYFMYGIDSQPAGLSTLILRSVKGTWEKKFVLKDGYSGGYFSGDNKTAIFKDSDTLRLVTLGSTIREHTIPIRNYKQPNAGTGEWLAYEPKRRPNTLILRNLLKGNELHFDSITNYLFGNSGNLLLLQRQTGSGNSLEWVNLSTERRSVIWNSLQDKIVSFSLDESDTQIAFIVCHTNNSRDIKTLWYYNTRMREAILKVTAGDARLPADLNISAAPPQFNGTGRYIYFYLIPPLVAKPNKTATDANPVMIDIWSYKDRVLRFPEVASNASGLLSKTQFTAVATTYDDHVACLEREDEYISAIPDEAGEFVAITKIKVANIGDQYWRSDPVNYYLRSLRDSTLILFSLGIRVGSLSNIYTRLFMPKGDYLIYYDLLQSHYFSYHILSGKTRNISQDIPVSITYDKSDTPILGGSLLRGRYPIGIAGWVDDGTVLIYDHYDIWKVDPSGNTSPKNITNGYGRRQHIQLRMAFEQDRMKYRTHSLNKNILLTAFNKNTKHGGYYRTSLKTGKDPILLSMGPWYIPHTEKATNKDRYIVQRQSATKAPNYFWTDDFRKYHPLTNLQPQQKFNWMQAELVNFKLPDGTFTQGILYKPENFDPKKKYPLIINYYETQSDQLFWYQHPAFVNGDLTAPWFVSRGYVFLKVDIHPKPGEIGNSAYNAITAGVQYLSDMPWIDANRIGLQGHSFGGFETYYLITHSHLFAAAIASAGVPNFISAYGGLQLGSRTGAESAEAGQMRMMNTLWDRPDLYIENSSIFKTNQVTTPLLIMHNRKDPVVPWSQGLQFFTGLRRLNQKVWMLQYDKSGHGVHDRDALDYTIRTTQFFDHYLKGTPPPVWMTKGIVVEMKGKDIGLDLDSSGNKSH